MDTTTAIDLAKSVFGEIEALINQGRTEALANSTSQNTSTSDSSSSGTLGTAENAWNQIQQSFTTAQAQALANLSGSEGNTSTSSTATASQSQAATTSDSATTASQSQAATASDSTATASQSQAATTSGSSNIPASLSEAIEIGQSQVPANLASDSLTNPGSGNSSTSSDAFNVQFVPGESGSGTIGQISGSFAEGQPAFSFTIGASGPVISSGDGEGASGSTLSSIAAQGNIANYVASLFGVTPTA